MLPRETEYHYVCIPLLINKKYLETKGEKRKDDFLTIRILKNSLRLTIQKE